jgi:hypothetical protein
MRPGTGDPGSTSVLGGALRSQALRLADLVAVLEEAASRHERGERAGRAGRAGTGRSIRGDGAGGTGAHDATAHERDLLGRAADELDRVGALLQAWTATSVEGAARLRELSAEAERADLVVRDHVIVEAPGPSRVDPEVRRRARAHLQELLNRVTGLHGRELARLGRELERSSASLAAVSYRARSGASPV